MNKTLTALAVSAAVSAALTAPVAVQADVTIYGLANLAFDYTNDGDLGTNGVCPSNSVSCDGTWRSRVSSYSSRLGFKGFEDLGSSLKAIWQIETEVDMDGDGGSNSFSLRNTFAGLQGGFGTVLLGKHDTPFKIAVRELDLFADTLADNRSITRGGLLDNSWDLRSPDTIAYISPEFFYGLKVLVAYVSGGEEFSNQIGLLSPLNGLAQPFNGNATVGSAESVALIYKNGGFYGSLAYEFHHLGTPGTGSVAATDRGFIPAGFLSGRDEQSFRAGLGFEFGPVKLAGMFQRNDDDFGQVCGRGSDDSCLARNVWDVGAAFAFGASALKAQYTRNTSTSFGDGQDIAWQYSVGLDYNLSKRTMVYALWTHLHNDNNSALSLTSSNSQVSSDPQAAQGLGASPEGMSVGIRHKF